MRKVLPIIIATITGKSRDFPDFEWCPNNWSYNLFRIYEAVFGRRVGVRAEAMMVQYLDENGKKQTHREFYTWEAFIAHTEAELRIAFSGLRFPRPRIKFFRVPVLALPNGGGLSPLPSMFNFAVAYDNSAVPVYVGSSTNAQTISYTVTGSNPIVFGIQQYQQNTVTWSSATYNGVAMSLVDTLTSGDTSPGRANVMMLVGPATGANNLVVNLSGNAEIVTGAVSYSGAKQSSQPDAHDTTQTSAATSISKALTTVAANAMLVSWATFENPSGVLSASSGIDNVRFNSAARNNILGDSLIVSPGSNTMTWANATSCDGQMFIFSIAPVASAATPRFRSLLGVGL